jgi:hypothetical protein
MQDDQCDPACELGVPSNPKPGKRRSGTLAPYQIHSAALALVIEAHGERLAIVEAFRLGQLLGHGRMGSLVGCKACKKKAVATVAKDKACEGGKPVKVVVSVCLLCGNKP